MEITKSACLTFWEDSLLHSTPTEQGRLPKKPMSGLFCGGVCLSWSCHDFCSAHGDHKVCLPHFLGCFFAPSNFDGAGSACLCHAMACVVAMEITKSARLAFWEVSLLRRTLTEQVPSLRSPCLACFVEGATCLWHVMTSAVAMEITNAV